MMYSFLTVENVIYPLHLNQINILLDVVAHCKYVVVFSTLNRQKFCSTFKASHASQTKIYQKSDLRGSMIFQPI
jgi:hypothetical protein